MTNKSDAYTLLVQENTGREQRVRELIEQNSIKYVLLYFVDTNNIARGKSVEKEYFLSSTAKGFGFDYYVLAQQLNGDMTEVAGVIPDVSGDMLAIPDLSTFRVFTPQPNTAIVLVDLFWKNLEPISFASRQTLKRILRKYAEKRFYPKAGLELEFSLSKEGMSKHEINRPYSIQSQIEFDAILHAIKHHAESMSIAIEAVVSEFDEWQFEIVTKYTDLLAAADNLVLLKHLVKTIAQQHGYTALFCAKPTKEQAGNGLHFHLSLWDEQRNLFQGTAEESPLLQQYLAGNLRFAQETALFFFPNPNSFCRLVKGSTAPTTITWGYDNRSVAFRVLDASAPSGRVENRLAGSDVNIYYVFSASLACGLLGIEKKLVFSPAVNTHAYDNSSLERLPSSMVTAVQGFCHDAELVELLGQDIITLYRTIKEHEVKTFSEQTFENVVRFIE